MLIAGCLVLWAALPALWGNQDSSGVLADLCMSKLCFDRHMQVRTVHNLGDIFFLLTRPLAPPALASQTALVQLWLTQEGFASVCA